jgi:hypothetical protein
MINLEDAECEEEGWNIGVMHCDVCRCYFSVLNFELRVT